MSGSIPKFDLSLLEPYDTILVFVQKKNDLDTCASAFIIATLVSRRYPEKEVFVVGAKRSKFLPDLSKFYFRDRTTDLSNNKILAILSEVSSPNQLTHPELYYSCNDVILLDHHEEFEEDNVFSKEVKDRFLLNINEPSYSSLCELLWMMSKENGWEMDKSLARAAFLGMYADTSDFNWVKNNRIFGRNVSEIADKGVDISEAICEICRNEYIREKIYAETMAKSERTGQLLILNVDPMVVKEINPSLFEKPDPDSGSKSPIKQKALLTWILRRAQTRIRIKNIIFIHYSLFKPFNSDKRVVFVATPKDNAPLKAVLRKYGFKENNSNWFRDMRFSEIHLMLSENKEAFTK